MEVVLVEIVQVENGNSSSEGHWTIYSIFRKLISFICCMMKVATSVLIRVAMAITQVLITLNFRSIKFIQILYCHFTGWFVGTTLENRWKLKYGLIEIVVKSGFFYSGAKILLEIIAVFLLDECWFFLWKLGQLTQIKCTF